MNRPVLTFFNNKTGAGKTSLVYHLSWMLADMGHRVLACDLDPQANLTAAFLDEDKLEDIWLGGDPLAAKTIYQCIQPLTEAGDLREPELQFIAPELALLPGDLALSAFEDQLSGEWPLSPGNQNPYHPYRMLTAFWQVAQLGAEKHAAEVILVDIGPNLGAINRSALIAADFIIVPLGADLVSLQGLRNSGPTLRRWRDDWAKRIENWDHPSFGLPRGRMRPIGYTVQQHAARLSPPAKAYDRWAGLIPDEYRSNILDEPVTSPPLRTAADPECLATVKPFRSLLSMGQEARKPIFHLTVADGAMGSHALAAKEAYRDFRMLAEKILRRIA